MTHDDLIQSFFKACTSEPRRTELGDMTVADMASLLWYWVAGFHDAMGDVSACHAIVCGKRILQHARECVMESGLVDLDLCRSTISQADALQS